MSDETPQRRQGSHGATPKIRPDDARGTPPGAGTMVGGRGGRIGNPPFVATEEQRTRARALAKAFPPSSEKYIALLLGISVSTLQRHFREDMDHGRAEMLAAIGAQFINRAMDGGSPTSKGDIDAQKFILARLGGWSNKVEVAGHGGGPIEHVDLSRLTDEQLEAYGRLAAIAAGVDPDTELGRLESESRVDPEG